MLQDAAAPARPNRLLLASDAFELADDRVGEAIRDAARRIARAVGPCEDVRVSPQGLDSRRETFQIVQAAEIWENHGEWVSEVEPALGPGIKERFEWASTIGPEQVDLNLAKLGRVRSRLDELLQDAELLCLPTVPRVAPLRNTRVDLKEVTYRNQAMCLLCIAGLSGLPQVSLPMARIDGLPIGLSLIGPRGSDTTLLALAREALGAGSPV